MSLLPTTETVSRRGVLGHQVHSLVLDSSPQLLRSCVEAHPAAVGDRGQVVGQVVPGSKRQGAEGGGSLELALQGVARAMADKKSSTDVRLG